MMTRKKTKLCMNLLSAELIGGNEDLICEILPRLPVRTLIRFKLVSKQWRSLISDPHFCLTHALKKSPTIPSGLFFYNTLDGAETIDSISLSQNGGNISSSFSSFSYPILLPPEASIKKLPIPSFDVSTAIAQSCNGLSLFGFSSSLMLYCVRNLATRQLKLIPLPHLKTNQRILICCLAFDPLISPHYKLVCITEVTSCRHHFLIYTSETGQWKDTNAETFECGDLYPLGVYWNGAVHWIIVTTSWLRCYHFDVKAEDFTVTSIPIDPHQTYYSCLRYFGEFNGHLHLVYGPKRKFNVLELDYVTLKWFIKYRVDINCLIYRFPEVVVEYIDKSQYCAFSILSVVRGEKEEDSALVMTIPRKVVSYNFRSKKVEVLSELPSWGDFNMNYRFASAYPFVATLYPL